MKKRLYKIFILFTMLLLSSCSLFINTDKIEEKADAAFEQKNFDEFNELYSKLEGADSEKAEVYLQKIKEHKYFKNPEANLNTIKNIEKKVPVLSDFSNYLYTVTEILPDLNRVLNEVDKNGTFYTIMTMDTLDKTKAAENVLDVSLSEINTSLITLDDLNAPTSYKSKHSKLVQSLEEYSQKLEQQYMFFSLNGPDIVSAYELTLKGNYYSLSLLNNLEEEFQQNQTELELAGRNLSQRISTLSTDLGINPTLF